MANKQIKDFTAQPTPQTGDFLLMQQAADDAVRKVTMQHVANFASYLSTRQIVVGAGDTPADNGDALKAAYATAKGLSPTSTDWVTIKLTSGDYDLGATGLGMDTDHIALIGEGGVTWNTASGQILAVNPVSKIRSSADATILLTCRSAVVADLAVAQAVTSKYCVDINNVTYYADRTLFRNVYFGISSGYRAVHSSTVWRSNSKFIGCVSTGAILNNVKFGGAAVHCMTYGTLGSWGAKQIFDGYAKDCYSASEGSFGGAGGVCSGVAEDCVADGDYGFGGSGSGNDGVFSGTARRCRNTGDCGFGGNKYGVGGGGCFPVGALAEDCVNEGDFGFAGGAVAGQTNILAGIARRCRNEGDGGFAGSYGGSSTNYITGTCEDCRGGDGSFGAGGTSTGTLRRCQSITRTVPIPGWNGKMIGCEFKITAGNVDCLLLVGDDSLLYNNILIGSGTGKSIEAAAAQDMVGNGNAMNLGLGGNVTNLVAGTSDVIDTDIDL